ncbi:MAG: type II toxin-antitoxin system HicB family antitoxin [Candidatus Altiarchaeota archaeon]
MKYTVVVEKGRESGYVAICPILRGCVSQGKTSQEALKNMKEAISDYIECLIEDNITVPQEVGKRILNVEVSAH